MHENRSALTIIRAALDHAQASLLDRPVALSQELSASTIGLSRYAAFGREASAPASRTLYLDVPVRNIVGLLHRSFAPDARTWRELLAGLHGNGWGSETLRYFESELGDEHFQIDCGAHPISTNLSNNSIKLNTKYPLRISLNSQSAFHKLHRACANTPILTEARIPMSNSDKWRVVAANVIAHAWRDPAYKASVLQNPKAALAAAGLTLPDSVQVSALENSSQNKYVVLPAQDRLEADPVAGAKLLKAITPLPKGVRVTLLQDTADTRHFVVPVPPAHTALQPHTDATAATAMAAGWEAVNLYTTANAVGEANAAGVQNVAGATEGVVVAVGAAVLT